MGVAALHWQVLVVTLLAILSIQVRGDADADPRAVPDPIPIPNAEPAAESDPEAEAQRYRWGYPGPGYPPSASGYPPPGPGYPVSGSGYPVPGSGYPPGGMGYPSSGVSGYPPSYPEGSSDRYYTGSVNSISSTKSPCEMTNQCCGMDKANCCFKGGQQRCYTIWERKCDTEDQPECQLRVDRHCHDVRVRDCKVITEIAYRNFAVEACFPKPLTECFEYTKKICSPTVVPEVHTITWVNERLKPIAEKEETHCFDQKTVNCTAYVDQEVVTEQERKQRKTTENQRRCRMVQKRQPDKQITVPVVKIKYNTMCYNVPKTTCSQNACRLTGYCSRGSNVCSMSEFSTNTICPEPSGTDSGRTDGARSGCQQIQQPVCYDSGSCQPNYQQCCSTATQRICRQVPQRITENVPQSISGTISWEEVCEDNPVEKVEYYYEPVQKFVNRTKENCQPIVQPQCHNYTVPTFGVTNETKSDKVTVTLPACHKTAVKDRYCHTFPEGDLGCRNSTVRKGFRINKVVCDKMVTKQECFNIPVADCRVGRANRCKMVPRQICQDTCSDSGFCQQCDAFRNGPGFGSCSSSTCGTYYPNDQTPTVAGWSESGEVVKSSGKNNLDTSQAYEIDDVESDKSQPDYSYPDEGDSSRWSGLSTAQAVPISIAEPREEKSSAVEEEEKTLKR